MTPQEIISAIVALIMAHLPSAEILISGDKVKTISYMTSRHSVVVEIPVNSDDTPSVTTMPRVPNSIPKLMIGDISLYRKVMISFHRYPQRILYDLKEFAIDSMSIGVDGSIEVRHGRTIVLFASKHPLIRPTISHGGEIILSPVVRRDKYLFYTIAEIIQAIDREQSSSPQLTRRA